MSLRSPGLRLGRSPRSTSETTEPGLALLVIIDIDHPQVHLVPLVIRDYSGGLWGTRDYEGLGHYARRLHAKQHSFRDRAWPLARLTDGHPDFFDLTTALCSFLLF
jgi:hypothetical protein